jgi:phosphoenolpyruvate---glycerone phosphotransferase subunit DhaL
LAQGTDETGVSYEEVRRWITEFAGAVSENKTYLTELDSAIGDADHGINMNRGMQAALAKMDGVSGDDIGSLLKTVGMTLVSTVGGAGGPLYGTLFIQMGAAAADKSRLTPDEWAATLDSGIQGVIKRGKAEPADKTMVDALLPALDALRSALADGLSLTDALKRSAAAAEDGMKGTTPLVARKGRASYLGERSAGHQDPGATSSYLLLKAAAESFGSEPAS